MYTSHYWAQTSSYYFNVSKLFFTKLSNTTLSFNQHLVPNRTSVLPMNIKVMFILVASYLVRKRVKKNILPTYITPVFPKYVLDKTIDFMVTLKIKCNLTRE